MQDRRFTIKAVFAAALAAALLATTLPVLAAAGGNFILGEGNSAGTKKTNLTSSANGHTLRVKNQAGSAALKTIGDDEVVVIKVKDDGGVPIKVTGPSPGTATGLSADLLDGRDSAEFVRVAGATDDDLPDGDDSGTFTAEQGNVLSVDITAPTAGWLTMTGAVNATGTAFDDYNCVFTEGATPTLVVGSIMNSQVDSSTVHQGSCSTVGFLEVAAGTYTINLTLAAVGAGTDFSDGSMWVHFAPFDGTGATSGL